MAEPQDSSAIDSESTLQLNIKTLDSRIYSLNVDKNIPIAAFKEKIASHSGVPVEQQRIIFRGKVLKDDHILAEYNVENGDTLHLVERQPQAASASNTGEATSNNSVGGNDPNAGVPRNRIGPIAHSIVLGTLNVGDPGEAAVPDISRVIGAVLNSIGFNNQTGGFQPGVMPSQLNQPEGYQASSGGQRQDGNSVPLQSSNGQSASHSIPFPLGPTISPPSLNTPIPDSLHTLMEFITRMEPALSVNGHQPNPSTDAHQPNQSTDGSNLPTAELPSNSLGLPTIEALSIVLQNAQRLLSDHAAPALSHIAGRLNQDSGSDDPAVRMQLQIESVQLGMAMQHLGALFLELGRTMLITRIGQSSAESFVNAGPAVYISPSGPNPIMAQPFPLQTNSIFTPSSGAPPTPLPMGVIGGSGIPRNVNIHIHTGAALAPILSTMGTRAPSEGTRGEHANATESGESGQARGVPGINITATSVPSQRGMVSISGAGPPGTGVSIAPNSMSNEEINAQIRRIMGNMQNENRSQSGQAVASTNQEQRAGNGATAEDTTRQSSIVADTNTDGAIIDRHKVQHVSHPPDIKMAADVNSGGEPSTSSEGVSHKSSRPNLGNDDENSPSGAPLGLGLGGLQPKKRKQPKTQGTSGDGASASSQIQQRAIGQHVLQSLASGSTNRSPSGQSQDLLQGAGRSMSTGRPNTSGQGDTDMANAMSQILDSPALDGLLSGVSQQTGIGSPDMLRNMLQQFTQNPEMRNTVNQIAQQVDNHDLGSMFSGLDRGPGGGVDLGRMMQQMMPIVSQALGGISPNSQLTPPSEQILSRGMTAMDDQAQRTDIRQVIQMLENRSLPEDIFNSLVDTALDVSSGDEISRETIASTLQGQGHLAQELIEMLHRDISERFNEKPGT